MASYVHSGEIGRLFASILQRTEVTAAQVSEITGVPASAPTTFWNGPEPPINVLRYQAQLLWELLLCRHVDNFQSYLGGLLHEVLIARPELLRSKETIELSLALSKKSMNDLVQFVAERKVNELSYGSFGDLAKYFEDRGLAIASDEEQQAITTAIAVRNISVHNRCVINDRFLRTTQQRSVAAGSLYQLSFPEVRSTAVMFANIVKRVDAKAASKFALASEMMSLDPLRHPLADADPPSEDPFD